MSLQQSVKNIAFVAVCFLVFFSTYQHWVIGISYTEGTSMLPTIPPGHFVLFQTSLFDRTHIPNGTIIIYRLNESCLIEHRIVEVHYNYYICKGDNNRENDPFLVEPEDVVGVYLATLW